jgi:hypothetical protein
MGPDDSGGTRCPTLGCFQKHSSFTILLRADSDSSLENAAPSLEDRCQILRQKIGSLEGDIFRLGKLLLCLY